MPGAPPTTVGARSAGEGSAHGPALSDHTARPDKGKRRVKQAKRCQRVDNEAIHRPVRATPRRCRYPLNLLASEAHVSATPTHSPRATRGLRLLRGLLLAALSGLLLGVALVLPWRWIAPPTSAFMLAERWSVGAPDYRWMPLAQISPQLAIAVVASEDQKFPTHYGFDLDSIRDALSADRNQPRGASTLSQQVAKNLFLWGGRSYLRKGIEAYLTLLMESLWGKQRILEIYLNIAEFAPGIYGAEAASQRLFGKPARRLTLFESSLLAAVLPNPKRMRVVPASDYVSERAAAIRREVRQLGGAHYLRLL